VGFSSARKSLLVSLNDALQMRLKYKNMLKVSPYEQRQFAATSFLSLHPCPRHSHTQDQQVTKYTKSKELFTILNERHAR
jgi:hypothetical protein